MNWILPPHSNSWMTRLLQLYIALNIIPIVGSYWVMVKTLNLINPSRQLSGTMVSLCPGGARNPQPRASWPKWTHRSVTTRTRRHSNNSDSTSSNNSDSNSSNNSDSTSNRNSKASVRKINCSRRNDNNTSMSGVQTWILLRLASRVA